MGIKPDEVKRRLRDAIVKYGADMMENSRARSELCIPVMKELLLTYEFDEACSIYNDAIVEVLQDLRILPPPTQRGLN